MEPGIRSISLTDKVALVTGGGRGTGRAFAQALASAGAKVAVVARSPGQVAETVTLIEQSGGQAIPVIADITDEDGVEQAVASVTHQLGPVDLLINNAGVSGPIGAMWNVDAKAWRHAIDVNLDGAYLCIRAVIPSMIRRKSGRIINIVSGAGRGPWPGASAYAVSKAALIRLTENLAAEVGESGITVFSMSPGVVRTAMVEDTIVGKANDPDPLARQVASDLQAMLEHANPPARPAQLLLYLASGQADALSGRYFTVGVDVQDMVERAEEITRDDLYTLRLREPQ